MKYKVGDKVRVKPNLTHGGVYGRGVFVSAMSTWSGKEVTIDKIVGEFYQIREDGMFRFYWDDEMLTQKVVDNNYSYWKCLCSYEKYPPVHSMVEKMCYVCKDVKPEELK